MQSFLEIGKTQEENQTVFMLKGWLDSANSPKLQTEIETVMSQNQGDIILDISELSFISSAGLRILLMIHNKCKEVNCKQIIRGANESTKELFNITGFSKILTIE